MLLFLVAFQPHRVYPKSWGLVFFAAPLRIQWLVCRCQRYLLSASRRLVSSFTCSMVIIPFKIFAKI